MGRAEVTFRPRHSVVRMRMCDERQRHGRHRIDVETSTLAVQALWRRAKRHNIVVPARPDGVSSSAASASLPARCRRSGIQHFEDTPACGTSAQPCAFDSRSAAPVTRHDEPRRDVSQTPFVEGRDRLSVPPAVRRDVHGGGQRLSNGLGERVQQRRHECVGRRVDVSSGPGAASVHHPRLRRGPARFAPIPGDPRERATLMNAPSNGRTQIIAPDSRQREAGRHGHGGHDVGQRVGRD